MAKKIKHNKVLVSSISHEIMTGESRTNERGNVFFIIMVGIVLFAALMFTFSRGTRQGGERISRKQATIVAADILSYAQKLERAVNRLLSKRVSESDISFDNSFVAGYQHTPVQPDRNKIFHPDGGGISWQNPPPNANDGSEWYFSSIGDVGETGGLPGEDELVAFLFNVNQNVCLEINRRLGIGDNIPIDNGDISEAMFTGTHGGIDDTISGALGPLICPVNPLCGHFAGCFQEEISGQRIIFYQVLMAR